MDYLSAQEELEMTRSILLAATIAMTGAMAVAFTAPVSAAQKKVSFQQAYNQCKAEIDKTFGPATDQNSAQRSAAGEACMKRRGHTLFGR
jgi:hypothetical protein